MNVGRKRGKIKTSFLKNKIKKSFNSYISHGNALYKPIQLCTGIHKRTLERPYNLLFNYRIDYTKLLREFQAFFSMNVLRSAFLMFK